GAREPSCGARERYDRRPRTRGAAGISRGARRQPGRLAAALMKIANLYADEWDEERDRDGWRIKEAFIGERIAAELRGASMSEVEPGNKLWPYHTHHANEEWVIVLRGEPTLRTHEGEQTLKEGDVVCFPRGKEGAHQIINNTDEIGRASCRARRASA